MFKDFQRQNIKARINKKINKMQSHKREEILIVYYTKTVLQEA